MERDKQYVRYEEALTDNEILLYAQMINRFKKNEIDFQSLKSLFLNDGVNIEGVPNDFSKKMMTISEANDLKGRISEQKYLYSDIDYFILNSNEFKDIIFRMDYKAIELLANSGDSEYQKTMISILMTQLEHSYDGNKELAAKRSQWKRRIDEYKSSLSEKERVIKSK